MPTTFLEMLEEALNSGEQTKECLKKEFEETLKLIDEGNKHGIGTIRSFLAGFRIAILYPDLIGDDKEMLKDITKGELDKI